ncbi:MAG: DUF342 domain-containing protein [Firmicutes bacterium]|nr:DUF342 domain-containing protein [Bacillota bacterium]
MGDTGRVTVQISADLMKVFVIVAKDDDKPVTMDEALAAIKGQGVVVAVDRDALDKAVSEPGLKVQVASGVAPVNGEDSQFKIEFAQPNGKPDEAADGRVDFYELHIVTSVKKGDLLATRIPPTAGTDGINAKGEPVPAKPGRLKPLPGGKNTAESETGDQLFAAIDGQAVVDRAGKITVSPVYTVSEDVDFSTGNVDFIGSVKVSGSICAGFSVKAGVNVEVGASCEALLCNAGEDVVVRGGIQGGRRQGRVVAGRDIHARFAENALMDAGRDVLVGEAILHSTVNAGRKVVVRGGKGLISGGVITAGEEVSARVIGSTLATPTEIQVGVDPRTRDDLSGASTAADKIKKELTQVELALKKLKELEETLPPDKKALIPVLTRQRFVLAGEYQRQADKSKSLQETLKAQRKGRIRADIIFPGVKVTIGGAVLFLKDEMKYVTLGLNEEGEIRVRAQ